MGMPAQNISANACHLLHHHLWQLAYIVPGFKQETDLAPSIPLRTRLSLKKKQNEILNYDILKVGRQSRGISDSPADGWEQVVISSLLFRMNGELASDPPACGEADVFNSDLSEVLWHGLMPPWSLYQSIKCSLSKVWVGALWRLVT